MDIGTIWALLGMFTLASFVIGLVLGLSVRRNK
jgi:hypothetical protein